MRKNVLDDMICSVYRQGLLFETKFRFTPEVCAFVRVCQRIVSEQHFRLVSPPLALVVYHRIMIAVLFASAGLQCCAQCE